MYIYYRQCHRSFKPAAVFPIEVELGIDLDVSKRYLNVGSHDDSPSDPVAQEMKASDEGQSPAVLPPVEDLLLDLERATSKEGQSPAGELPPVDDLLLGLGLGDGDSLQPPSIALGQ